MKGEYNLYDFISQLNKWRGQLIKALLAIILVSVIGSFLMPNYYKAETTFYAASPDLAKPIPIGDDEKDFRIYGDDNDLDRLFTISTSYEVLFYLVDSFDLYSHYDIDKDDPKAKFKVKEELLENYQTIKTKYGALYLTIEDKDPTKAAEMTNGVRNKIAQIAQQIVKDSQKKLINNYHVNIEKKQSLSDSLSTKLLNINKKVGVFDSRSQTAIYSSILATATSDFEDSNGKVNFFKKYPTLRDSMIKYMAKVEGAKSRINKSNEELLKFAPYLSDLRQLQQEQGRLLDQISLDKERLKQLEATYNAEFTALHIVERAEVPVQKSRPKRLIIILLSTMIGFVLCLFAVFAIENIQGVNLKEK